MNFGGDKFNCNRQKSGIIQFRGRQHLLPEINTLFDPKTINGTQNDNPWVVKKRSFCSASYAF